MLPCSLPYIRNIRKTINTTIWPNNNNNNINNNNNNNGESNCDASFPKKSESEGGSGSAAVYKVIIGEKGSDQTCDEPLEEVKVGPVFGTPHPLRRVSRPDSPHVDGRSWSRRGEGGRCERISEREEEDEKQLEISDSENNLTEGDDGDYEEEEGADSVFEEESESEETECPKSAER